MNILDRLDAQYQLKFSPAPRSASADCYPAADFKSISLSIMNLVTIEFKKQYLVPLANNPLQSKRCNKPTAIGLSIKRILLPPIEVILLTANLPWPINIWGNLLNFL